MQVGKSALLGLKRVVNNVEYVWATDYKNDAIFIKGTVKDLKKYFKQQKNKNNK